MLYFFDPTPANREIDRQAFAPLFADWRFPWLDIPALIEKYGGQK